MTRFAEEVISTLIVRAWRERDGEAPERSEFRGEVRNVVTSEVRYFRRIDGLLRVLREFLRATPEDE